MPPGYERRFPHGLLVTGIEPAHDITALRKTVPQRISAAAPLFLQLFQLIAGILGHAFFSHRPSSDCCQ